jgi:hypothetical protein
VKQKNNIFEELNKMRNLIHAKAGTVISEQGSAGADVGTIMRELDKFNSDEQKIVDIIKKYKDKASFKSFTDQYKTISGKDFGADIHRALFGGQDRTEIEDLTKHLSSLGITLTSAPYDRSKGPSYIFGGLDTSVAPAAPATGTRTPEAIKNINATFCGVKNGLISGGKLAGKKWADYKTTYSVTAAEEAAAQKTCPTVQTGIVTGSSNKSNDYTRIVGDYSKKVQTSLGLSPTGQISDNELEKILTQLDGEVSGEISQELPKTSDGQPDLEKILASL